MIHAEFSIGDGMVAGHVSRAGDEFVARTAFGLIRLIEIEKLMEEGEFERAHEVRFAVGKVCEWDMDDYQQSVRLGAWAMSRAGNMTKRGRDAEERWRKYTQGAIQEAETLLFGDKWHPVRRFSGG